MEHNVFISWSGEYSHEMALELRDWLPLVIYTASPWVSSEDIAKGTNWNASVTGQLAACKVGVVVLTRENIDAPWVLFEAGAIYKALPDRNVCTLLCDLNPPVKLPLGLFQATQCTKEDVRKLVLSIDAALGATSDVRVPKLFEKLWPDLETKVKALASKYSKPSSATAKPVYKQEDVVLEILSTVRSIKKELAGRPAEEEIELNAYRDLWPSRGTRPSIITPSALADFERLTRLERHQVQDVIKSLAENPEGANGQKVSFGRITVTYDIDRSSEPPLLLVRSISKAPPPPPPMPSSPVPVPSA